MLINSTGVTVDFKPLIKPRGFKSSSKFLPAMGDPGTMSTCWEVGQRPPEEGTLGTPVYICFYLGIIQLLFCVCFITHITYLYISRTCI